VIQVQNYTSVSGGRTTTGHASEFLSSARRRLRTLLDRTAVNLDKGSHGRQPTPKAADIRLATEATDRRTHFGSSWLTPQLNPSVAKVVEQLVVGNAASRGIRSEPCGYDCGIPRAEPFLYDGMGKSPSLPVLILRQSCPAKFRRNSAEVVQDRL
jgi:hypothetical protein